MSIFTGLYVLVGLALCGLAVPLILRRVPPNSLYGFRTPRTLSDPTIWYQANAVAGYCLLAAGAIVILAVVGLRFWFPAMAYTRYSLICTLILVGAVIASALISWLYLQSLAS